MSQGILLYQIMAPQLRKYISEFLNHHLKSVMKSGKLYVKGTGDFSEKNKSLGRIPEDAFLVTACVVGLYPSIPHNEGLKALYEKLEERLSYKNVSSADLVDTAEFALKNNFFEFDSKVKQQMHCQMHVSSWMKLGLTFWKHKL